MNWFFKNSCISNSIQQGANASKGDMESIMREQYLRFILTSLILMAPFYALAQEQIVEEIIKRESTFFAGQFKERIEKNFESYPPVSSVGNVRNLTLHSYYFEKDFPGFCGIVDTRRRNLFLGNATEIRFKEGGFLKYIENRCFTRIYYIKSLNSILFVHRSSDDLEKNISISQDLILQETKMIARMDEFVRTADALAVALGEGN